MDNERKFGPSPEIESVSDRDCLEAIARLTLDGEDGYEQETDDAFATLASIIRYARRAVNRPLTRVTDEETVVEADRLAAACAITYERLLAERDALRAEVARLREAATRTADTIADYLADEWDGNAEGWECAERALREALAEGEHDGQ